MALSLANTATSCEPIPTAPSSSVAVKFKTTVPSVMESTSAAAVNVNPLAASVAFSAASVTLLTVTVPGTEVSISDAVTPPDTVPLNANAPWLASPNDTCQVTKVSSMSATCTFTGTF